eukprot:36145-Hanusia_phi.AAC.1
MSDPVLGHLSCPAPGHGVPYLVTRLHGGGVVFVTVEWLLCRRSELLSHGTVTAVTDRTESAQLPPPRRQCTVTAAPGWHHHVHGPGAAHCRVPDRAETHPIQ